MDNTGQCSGGGTMAEGHPGGVGGLLPHSSQHPAQYSPVAQPRAVGSGAAQYIGVPQPFFFHPTLNAFFPGPPPPRHPFLVPSGAPPPAAPPPAALPLCHTHHVGGRAAAASAAAGAAPTPPPSAPAGIPAAPPDAPPGFVLSSLCVAPSFGSVAVLPPATHERLASPAAVPAPPTGAAGAVGAASRKSPPAAASLPYAAQQQAFGVGKPGAGTAGTNRAAAAPAGAGKPSSGGEVPRLDLRAAQTSTSTHSSPSSGTATCSEGTSHTLATASTAAEKPPVGRDAPGAPIAAAETQVGRGVPARQHPVSDSGAATAAASSVDSALENKVGGGADVRRTLESEAPAEINNPLVCGGRSGERESSSVGSRQPCHQQLERASHIGGKEDWQTHVVDAPQRPHLATRSPDDRSVQGDLGAQDFGDAFPRADAVQQKLQHYHQEREGGVGKTRLALMRRPCSQGGGGEENAAAYTSDIQKIEERRGDLDGGSAGRPGSREGAVNFGAAAAVGVAGEGRSGPTYSGGGTVGEVGAAGRESSGEIGVRSTAATAATVPSFTQQERGFWEQPAVDVTGEGGAEERRNGGKMTSPERIADQKRGSRTEERISFSSGGGGFGAGFSRATRSAQESGRSRVAASTCAGQSLAPPRKQQHQGGPSQQQHTPHEQLLYPLGRRGTSSASAVIGGSRGGGRPHAHGGSTTGGPRHPAGFNGRQPVGAGVSRPVTAGGFPVGTSRRSGGVGSYTVGERERDFSRLGKRRRRSSSGERRMSEGHDTRSRCSSSAERRRRRGSPSIQRPVVEEARSSRSGSIASLPLGEEEDELNRRAGGALVGAGAGAPSDEGDDGEMELERSNSNSLERRSPSPRAARDDRSSISPSPASDVYTDVQTESCSGSNTSGADDSGSIGLTHRERNGRRRLDDGGQSRTDVSRGRLHIRRSSKRSNSGDRGSRKSSVLWKDSTADRSTHPPPPPRPPSPCGHVGAPAETGFPFATAAFPRSAGSSAGMWVESKTGGGEAGDPPGTAHTGDAAKRGGAGAPLKSGPTTGVSSSESREAGSPSGRGPLFDLWVPTTFHPLCPERVRLVLGPKGRTHKEMEQFTKTRVQLYGRELVRDTSKHEYDPFRDNQPLHLVVGDKVRRGEWTDANIQQMKEKLEAFLEQLVQRTWPRTEQRQPIPFYDKQLHVGPSAGPLVYVDALGKWDEPPPRDLLPCLVYDPTRCVAGIVPPHQQQQAGTGAAPATLESSVAATGEVDARARRIRDEEIGVKYEGDTSLLLNCTPPLCLLLLTLQAAHGLLVEEGVQELITLPLAFEKKWDVRFLFRREDFQAAGLPSFTAERKELLDAAVNSLIYTPEGHMHEEAVSVLTRFVKEFPEVFDLIEDDAPAPVSDSSIPSPPPHRTLKIRARDHPDFASVAQRFKSTDPWLQGGQPQVGVPVYAPAQT